MIRAILRRADEAERTIAEILSRNGRQVVRMGAKSPFDMRVDGRAVEIKTGRERMISPRHRSPSFRMNCHRHGILRERCEWYIFRLERAIDNASVYVLLKAPIRRKTFAISRVSLERGKWNRHIENFNKLCAGKWAELRKS